MPDIKLVGAVAIKVRPNAKGFRGETQRQISKELAGVDASVKVKVKGDTTDLVSDTERAKKAIEAKELTLKVGLDYDSIRRAQQQLDKAVKNMSATEIKVTLDDEGIAKAQAKLDEMMGNAEVEITYVDDEKGYRTVLEKIAEIRRQKLEKEISFEIDDASLDEMERKFQNLLDKGFSKGKVTLSYDNNRESITRAIADVNRELDRIKQVEFDVTLDKKSLKTARRMLEAALSDEPVELKVDYDDQDSLKRTRDRLKEMISELNSKTLNVAFNKEALRSELQRIDDMIKDEVEDKKREVDIPVHANGLERVARQLQFASRARRVPFHVVVDQKSLIVAEGILRSLAGVNTLQSAGRGLETLITKFDTILLKGAAWGSAIVGIADSLFYMLSATLTVAGGMAQVVGLAAAAPVAFAALGATVLIGISVFKDFGAAAHGIDAALKRLPPSGQKAALSIRTVFADMREAISEQFWDKASDAMLRFVEKSLPVFTRGLAKTSGALGGIFGRILDSFTNMAAAGGLEKMWNNLVKGFENSAAGATAMWDALNTLGLKGSEMFPRFGTWLTDMSVRFDNWISKAAKNGDIVAWIEGGVNSLKDMWHTTGAIIDQFRALTRAANLVGNNGLDDFRRNMQYIAKVMLAEPFQSRMGTIFAGARAGAHGLAEGVWDLGRAFGESAVFTSELLTLLGRFGGDVLSGFSKTVRNFKFQNGILDALRGMSDMVRGMSPAFEHLGNLVGSLGSISSNVFRGLAPVFNTLLDILATSVGKIEGNLSKLAPSLLTLTNNMLNLARGPIFLLVDVLNGLLGVVNDLPTPLRNAAVAFGIFLLLRNQFGAFATALAGMWTKITTTSVAGATAQKVAASGVVSSVSAARQHLVLMADGSVRQMSRFGIAVSNGMANAKASIRSFEARSIVGKLSAAAAGVAGVVTRINASLSLIGGIPGLVIGGLGVAMTILGGNAADAAANVDILRESLDQASGAATSETLSTIAGKLSEIDKAGDSWANFWRGVVQHSQAGNETLERLGINIGDVARIIAGSRGEYDAFVGSLKTLGGIGNINELMEFINTGGLAKDPSKRPMSPGDEFATNIGKLKKLQEQADALKNLGLDASLFQGPNAIAPESIQNLTRKMDEQRLAVELSQRAWETHAAALGTTVARAQEVAGLVQIMGDTSRDAASKIDAINRSLKLLNDNGLSEQEAKMNRVEGLAAQVENAKAIAESIKASRKSIFDQNGLISEQSKAGRDLFKILSETADNVKIQAQSTYDAARLNGKTTEAAAAEALKVVKGGHTDLQAIAKAAGITVGDLEKQWGTFFGKDWTLEATFSANQDKFLAAKAEAERLGMEFDGKEFMAWLLAQPDPAKVTVEQVEQRMRDYAAKKFQATLDALPAPAQAMIAEVLGQAKAFANGDYAAVLKAFNNANPIVQSAIAFIQRNYTNPAWMATISAAINSGSLASVEYALIQLTRPRTAVVNVTYSDVGRDVALAGRAPKSANGSILDRFARGIGGFNPQYAKFFANGGIEQHVASVFRPSSVLRFFAEPETGGEAYIPLAVSKRPRSLSILGEVARKFGYELTKATSYASGSAGGHTVPTRTSTTSVTVGTINTVDPETAVKKLQQMQRDALAVAGIK